MLEVCQFCTVCMTMLISMYVTFFVSWTYKLPMLLFYIYHRNARFIQRSLFEYKSMNPDCNECISIFITAMYVPFFACNLLNMMYDVVSVVAGIVQDWIFKRDHPLRRYADMLEEKLVELNEFYLIRRNQTYNKMLLYLKEIVFQNLSKHGHSAVGSSIDAHNHAKNTMKKHINERIMRLKKKK